MNFRDRNVFGCLLLAFVCCLAEGGAAATEEIDLVPICPSDKVASAAQTTAVETRFRMPMLAHDWWNATAYVDLDPSSGIQDYECDVVTYDEHNGNDFAIRNFVAQDEGRFIVAGAAGTVVQTDDGHFDKETTLIPGKPSNGVVIEHDDLSRSVYLHMRKWSVMVVPGQEVLKGQPIGLVGSSGYSSGPHLHFAVFQDGLYHEPHAGDCNLGQPLWEDQADHIADSPVELFDAGVTTVDPAGAYKFRPPDVHHFKQQPAGTTQYAWFYVRACHVGDVIRMIYRDPSDAVFKDVSVTCPQWYSRVPVKWTTVLPGSGSLGTWSIELLLNDVTQTELSFVYDDEPYADPVAQGRTVVVDHGVAGDELHGSDADSEVKEFRVVTTPIHGRVVLHGPRQKYFTYVPDSGYEGSDFFRFEVEDGQGQVSPQAIMNFNVSPIVANTLRLEGEDDHIAVPDDGSLNLAGAFTLEAWVRRTMGSAQWQTLVDRRNPDNTTGFSLAIQPDSTLRLQVGSGTAAAFAHGTTAIPMNRWTHVAGTWDGQSLRLYVDGVQESAPVTFSGPIAYPGMYETWLGRSRDAGNSFRGEIDEIRIWNVARSSAQLKAGASCVFLDAPPPAALHGWWRMQGDPSDSSGQDNHGTIVGSAFFRSSDAAMPFCASEDTDGDGYDDSVDNCALTANPAQTDADLDGIGDACDLCPGVSVASRADFDRDGVGDACDVCPFLADTDQLDSDSDGSGDVCDPDPHNASAGVPSDAIDVSVAHDTESDVTTLIWPAEPHATEYQVVRGSLAEIRARFYGTCRSAGDPDPSDTAFADAEVPAPGELFGYLVVGVGPAGVRGPAGLDSNASQRDLRAKDCL